MPTSEPTYPETLRFMAAHAKQVARQDGPGRVRVVALQTVDAAQVHPAAEE